MSRRRRSQGGDGSSKVTIHLSAEMAMQLDQYQNAFGIDSRSTAAEALVKAGMSAVPLDTMIFEISQASVKEHRKFFTNKMIEFFEEQAAVLRGHRP